MTLELHAATVVRSGKRLVGPLSEMIPAGQLTVLLGPNGAGKSTTLRLAAGLITPAAGMVTLGGQVLHRLSPRKIARQLAWAPQDTHLEFDFSVADIVSMGRNPYLGFSGRLTARDWEVVNQALRLTDLEELRDRSVMTLSGGERQRALLARALAADTPLILMDEPTANLDIAHQLAFLLLCRSLVSQQAKTIILALHDLNAARRFADHVILLERGQVVSRGAPAQALSPEVLERVFHVQVRCEGAGHLVFDSLSSPGLPG
jgi:iron complex transport system ATP-binding protein